MIINPEEIFLFQTAIQAFQDEFSLEQNWLITGSWEEGKEKIFSLLKGELYLTPSNLSFLNKKSFFFTYKRAFVSYSKGVEDKHATYYQQRFYSTELNDVITLKKYLFGINLSVTSVRENLDLLDIFHLKELLDEEVIKLSNGEGRKAEILKALLDNPEVLILDNPNIGVDQETLPELESLFNKINSRNHCIILKGKYPIAPVWISNILLINSPTDIRVFSAAEYKQFQVPETEKHFSLNHIHVPETLSFKNQVVKLSNISVKYGEKNVLQNLNWEIKSNEKWLLSGENGAGKSTLLSLIYADHPQSYSNHIEVFGILRGSGESIWDIKENIGYYSPELFYFFDKSLTCEQTILSGMYNNPYYKATRSLHLEAYAKALFLLYFPDEYLSRPLNKLTQVNQRVVIFLRALAKNAPLILLDEPFQGFSDELILKSKQIVDWCCRDKALIFVSHDMNDIPSCISRQYKLEKRTGFPVT